MQLLNAEIERVFSGGSQTEKFREFETVGCHLNLELMTVDECSSTHLSNLKYWNG